MGCRDSRVIIDTYISVERLRIEGGDIGCFQKLLVQKMKMN